MKCPGCGVDVMDAPLYRVNSKGVPGVFACIKCCPPGTPDDESRRLCETINTDHRTETSDGDEKK